jgi:(1->4)-alpha-D-glucan 1-alpha-D-glucosylmutase
VLYQTLVGMWPAREPNAHERDALRERALEFARKAAREAKARTSWTDPDEEYERALASFINPLFDSPGFLTELQAFVATIAAAGTWNAIARTVLHLTSPGFPDIYQGDELWNYSLVDPDNRRPVAYDVRERLLADLDAMSPSGDIAQPVAAVDLANIHQDTTKLAMIRNLLRARRAHDTLFAHGSYQPLAAHGSLGEHIVAFARRSANETAIVVVPRLVHALAPATPPVAERWRDTELHVPADLAGTRWHCAISGIELTFPGASHHPLAESNLRVPIASILATIPVAVLLRDPPR